MAPIPVPYQSFGARKARCSDTADICGPEGVDFWTHTKLVALAGAATSMDLGFPQALSARIVS